MDKIAITNKNGESITLGNREPYFLEKLDGAVNVEMEVQKSPKQDGLTYFDNTLTSRALSIEGMIMAKGDAEVVLNARRKMEEVLNPKLVEVTVTYRDKEIKAVAESTPVFPGGTGSKGRYYQKYLIHLVCHEPFWIEPFYESREMSYIMGGISFKLFLPTTFSSRGFRRVAENKGDVDTPVEIEFRGPAYNPKVTNVSTGEYIQVNRELRADDTLTIATAFGRKHVKINGENAFHYIDLNSVFWQLKPGNNLLSYQSNNDSMNTRVKVKWKNRYIGF